MSTTTYVANLNQVCYASNKSSSSNFQGTVRIGAINYGTYFDYRTYANYDLSGVSTVHSSDVVSATLMVKWHYYTGISEYANIDVVDSSWTDSGLTWNNMPSTSATIANPLLDDSKINVWCSYDITDLVKSWLDGSIGKNGLRFTKTTPDDDTTQIFFYAYDADISNIQITYNVPVSGHSFGQILCGR